MKKKSVFWLVSLVLMFVVFLTACGNNETATPETSERNESVPETTEAEQPNDVTINMIYAIGDASHAEGISNIIKAFQEKYPHITFQENNAGTGSYLELLTTKDAVGEFPDIMEMRDVQVFADAGKLAPIPTEVHGFFEELPVVNGEKYVAPISLPVPQGIIYNKKIYRDLGLEEPKTFDEFLEISKTIKDSGVSPLVVGGADLWHMGFLVNKFLIDHLYVDDFDWNSKRIAGDVSFTDENVVKALTQLKSLWDEGLVDTGWLSTPDNQTVSMLVTEKAAMLYSGTWMFNQILEADPNFEVGFYALPDENGAQSVVGLPTVQGWGLSTEAAEDPDKVEAYKLFVEFFFEEEQYTSYLAGVNGISATVNPITYDAIEPMQAALEIANDPAVNKSLMINNFYGENQIPPQFRDWFYKVVQEVLMEQRSVEDALEETEKEWDVFYRAWQQ